jgi:hypothetical protein
MLLRDEKTGRLKKQPAKIGDKVIMFINNRNAIQTEIGLGFTPMKPYKVIATQMSKEGNRKCWNTTYPLCPRPDRFGVFVIDDLGDKRYVNLGTDVFGITVEVLPNE